VTRPPPVGDGVDIRWADGADLGRIVELLDAGSLQPGREDLTDVAPYAAAFAAIGSGPGGVLVAERHGEVVGVCQLIVFRHLQSRGGLCAEVESVHVGADHQNRGIGRRLMNEAIEHARALGCYRVQLTSNAARTDAHRFYESLGFEPTHVGFKLSL